MPSLFSRLPKLEIRNGFFTFEAGLRALPVWYGHALSVVWMQTELPSDFAEEMKKLNLAETYIQSG